MGTATSNRQVCTDQSHADQETTIDPGKVLNRAISEGGSVMISACLLGQLRHENAFQAVGTRSSLH